jgi:hypothetical protein
MEVMSLFGIYAKPETRRQSAMITRASLHFPTVVTSRSILPTMYEKMLLNV